MTGTGLAIAQHPRRMKHHADLVSADWPEDQTEAAQGRDGEAKHLWEESWDDDDTTDDFSTQLKEELKKVEASKRK
jgi:hypothetical protein